MNNNSSTNEAQTLLFLGKHIPKRFSVREVSQEADIPYATFYRIIKKYDDIISSEKVGTINHITLDITKDTTIAHLTIASDSEKQRFLQDKPFIRRLEQDITTKDVVLLFGSYAKGKETKHSDVDLRVVNETGEQNLSFSTQELVSGIPINPIFVTENEFKEMLQCNEENVGTQALKNHILLNNPLKHWELVFDALR